MCTVSFVPIDNSAYIFTSNRDENPSRAAAVLNTKMINAKQVLYPQDPESSGSWIAISDTGQLLCILNGAFEAHKRKPPYRLSRGLMALQYFEYSDVSAFVMSYNFEGIEAFTCIIVENAQVHELRWDERELIHTSYPISEAKIWSSSTLYTQQWQTARKEWFEDWLGSHVIIDQSSVLDFHKSAGIGDGAHDLVMNRSNIVKTTSITSVMMTPMRSSLKFEQLEGGSIQEQELILTHKSQIDNEY